MCVCNCAYMTGGNQATYWKEGGRESPMPPVLSRGGGSSGWLSVHWDPPSEWALSARTNWETHREREKEYLLKSRYIQLTNNNTYFVEWYRPHSEEREKIKSKTSTDSATLKDKHTQWCWHRRQPHLVYKYMLWNEMLQKRPGDDWWLFAKTTWETQRVT